MEAPLHSDVQPPVTCQHDDRRPMIGTHSLTEISKSETEHDDQSKEKLQVLEEGMSTRDVHEGDVDDFGK